MYNKCAAQEKYSSPSGQDVLVALFESDMITTAIIFVGTHTVCAYEIYLDQFLNVVNRYYV